jgi:hypothetical protein
MRATWKFKAVRPGCRRSTIRRRDGTDRLTGSTHEALQFSQNAHAHLCNKGVIRVEAWSQADLASTADEPPADRVVFTIRPHPNGRDWLADQTALHHGGWFRSLRNAVDYALFRGSSQICEIHILDAKAEIKQVILANQLTLDFNPIRPPSVGNSGHLEFVRTPAAPEPG